MMKIFITITVMIFMMMVSTNQLFKVWSIVDILIIMLFMFFCYYSVYEVEMFLGDWMVLDSLSFSLIVLSLFLFNLMFMASSTILNKFLSSFKYLILLLVLLVSLVMGFLSNNYFLFYIMFEVSLIPTLFIILGWGVQPERLQAGIYFLMYTLMASLPLLIGLVYLYNIFYGMEMWDSLLVMYTMSGYELFYSSKVLGMILIMAFLVKLPLFLAHLWLPKAHVEAPVAGSMVLAGVLLKLGGYGLIRLSMKTLHFFMSFFSFFTSLSLSGMVFIGLVCCRMNDLKSLVAYSSVSHMALVLSGILTFKTWGINGGLMMMVSHGVSSSGLFCFVNLVYERVGSRSLLISKGLILVLPLFSLFMFLLCCSNISAPPSINLLSEISLIMSLMGKESFTMLMFPLGSFLGAVFTFYLFSYSQHGSDNFEVFSVSGGSFLEFHSLNLHLLPINIIILSNDLFFVLI